MKVGTKSVLYGAHCFLLHPIFVAAAWIKLYGFPFDPRVWIAFFVHDMGYWRKPNMDGPEGETHPELGARIMHLFDGYEYTNITYKTNIIFLKEDIQKQEEKEWIICDVLSLNDGSYNVLFKRKSMKWHDFSLYHSRFYAKKKEAKLSKLCFADKLAMCMEPDWFYLFRIKLSGEIDEYMRVAEARNMAGEQKTPFERKKLATKNQKDWREACVSYAKRWVEEHKNGQEDTWTNVVDTND